MTLYKNKYRIESARLKNWDYSSVGMYFITVCTDNREHFFGECLDGKMKLSTIGAMVQGFWYEIPKHFPHVALGEFVVMPNHIHGILVLNNIDKPLKMVDSFTSVETLQCNVSTLPPPSQKQKSTFYQQISPKSGSIATIIRSFKSICSKHIHKDFPDKPFAWQERFWDNIIKDETAFITISNYIIDNPKDWQKDKFYSL